MVTLENTSVAAIKTATHALIARLGGLLAAASVCRVSVPVLSECQSLNHPHRVMPLDVALQLEMVAGEPIVSGTVARMQGWTLTRPGTLAAPEIGRAVAVAARSAGAATAAFVEAQCDGRIDPAERAELRRHFETVRDSADAALAGLAEPAAPALKAVG